MQHAELTEREARIAQWLARSFIGYRRGVSQQRDNAFNCWDSPDGYDFPTVAEVESLLERFCAAGTGLDDWKRAALLAQEEARQANSSFHRTADILAEVIEAIEVDPESGSYTPLPHDLRKKVDTTLREASGD